MAVGAWRGPAAVAGRTRGARYGLGLLVLVVAALAALLPQALAMAALAGIGVGAVLLARPELALYLLVFSVPYESLHEVNLGGLNATATEFIAFCAGAAFLMQSAINGEVRVRWAWWRWPLLLFAVAMLASMSGTIDIKLSIKEFLKLGEMLLAYLLVLRYIDSPTRLRRLLLLIAIAALSQALLGVVQAAVHFGPASFLRGGVLRASGTFDQPNPFAGYLNFTLPLLLASELTGTPLVGRLTRPALVILSVGVLLSVSRGALLASLAAALVMALVAARRLRPLVGAGVVGLVALVVGTVFGVVPGSLTNGVATTLGINNVDVVNPTPVTWAVAERLAHMLAGLRMFADHPWLGVGIGNYAAAYPKYQVAPVWGNPLGHAHNYYINIAAEAGIVGLIAFLVVFISAAVIAARLYRRAASPFARTVALGTLGVLATVAVQNFFDNIFVHAMEAQFALVMGVATVACRQSVEAAQARSAVESEEARGKVEHG